MILEYIKRLASLMCGVAVTALGISLMLQADVGLESWGVLQQGMSRSFGITYGTASVIVGTTVILIAILCGEQFGIGTLANVFLCGPVIDGIRCLGWIPRMDRMLPGIIMLLFGMEFLALGTWLYMKSALGAGPRDALMVALSRKTGRSPGLCRSVLEIIVIVVGWRLGGPVGIGTVITAIGTGTFINLTFSTMHFNVKSVRQENLAETLRNLRG